MLDSDVVPVQGVDGTYCFSVLLGDDLLVAHVVRTGE
jgi:hypothetical protein